MNTQGHRVTPRSLDVREESDPLRAWVCQGCGLCGAWQDDSVFDAEPCPAAPLPGFGDVA